MTSLLILVIMIIILLYDKLNVCLCCITSDDLYGIFGFAVCVTYLPHRVEVLLTESLMMLRNVLLKRMRNCVRQLAEKLWQPSEDEES